MKDEDMLLADLSDSNVRDLATMCVGVKLKMVARVVRAFLALRRHLKQKKAGKAARRNCDVMTTAISLRKGWERRCEYGTPCCPFEYAMEPFGGEVGK